MAGTVAGALPQVRAQASAGAQDSAGAFQTGGIVAGQITVSSYATSGVTVTAAQLGLQQVYGVIFISLATTKQIGFQFTPAAGNLSGTLIMYDTDSTLSETSNADNVGAIGFVAWGVPAAFAANS